MTHPVQPLRVVQLSDFHLFADTDGKLLGLNTQFSLEAVLDRVRREQPDMDLILATGDLSKLKDIGGRAASDANVSYFVVEAISG